MSRPPIILEHDEAVAVVTLNRPEQRNALTDEMLTELTECLTRLDDAHDVRAIVLAGSEKVFASGADVRALLERSVATVYAGARVRQWQRIQQIRTPLIAAVSGFCLGGGCELVMMADIAIASKSARFGLPETILGLIPGAGGTQMLPRAIGKAKAMDVVLTGRLLDAAEAERTGLISRVSDPDSWLADARAVAATVAARPAFAQQLAKEAIAAAFETPLRAGIGVERKAFGMAFASDDAREGMTAFLEKRDPVWRHE